MSTETMPVQAEEQFETVERFDAEPKPAKRPKRKYTRKPKPVSGVAGTEQQLWNEVEERIGHIYRSRLREAMDDILKSIDAGEPGASLKFDANTIAVEVGKQTAKIIRRALGLDNGKDTGQVQQ